jgi:chromosomal replication initiator protein
MRDFLLRGTWIKSIKKDVAAEYGLTVEELCGPSQRANVVKARHEAFLRVREETAHSYTVIARHFNRKDHTTVIHGCNKARERRAAHGQA